MTTHELEGLRALIDMADAKMLAAISEHLKLSLKVELAKRNQGLEILDINRGEEKRQKLIEAGARLKPPLDENFCSQLWDLIHNYCLGKQYAQREKS